MKKTFFLAGIVSLLITLAVNAQDTTANKPTMQDTNKPAMMDTKSANDNANANSNQSQQSTQEQKKYGNPTVDSILSKYTLVPMPNALTTEQIFPVIGQYQSNANSSDKITVTLDDQNKGFVWIEGLPQGKAKGVLKESPATYKIPAQKTAEGTDVPEGTLIYDKDSKIVNVMLGRPFNDQDPASVFTAATTTNDQTQSMENNDQATNDQSKMDVTKNKTTKSGKAKTKMVKPEEPAPFVFTGTKIEQTTATNNQ